MDGRRPPCEQLQEPGWSAFSLTSWERACGCLCWAPAGCGPLGLPGTGQAPSVDRGGPPRGSGAFGSSEASCAGAGGRGTVTTASVREGAQRQTWEPRAGSLHGPESRSVNIAVTVKNKISPL